MNERASELMSRVNWRSLVCVCSVVTACAHPSRREVNSTPLVTPPAPIVPIAEQVNKHLTRAFGEESRGNLTLATFELELALTASPSDWRVLLALARAHALAGHDEPTRDFGHQAVTAFERQHPD